jgi:hypothetical protein
MSYGIQLLSGIILSLWIKTAGTADRVAVRPPVAIAVRKYVSASASGPRVPVLPLSLFLFVQPRRSPTGLNQFHILLYARFTSCALHAYCAPGLR